MSVLATAAKLRRTPNPISDVLSSAQLATRNKYLTPATTPASSPTVGTAHGADTSGASAPGAGAPPLSPDFYKNLINNDSLYGQQKLDLSAESVSDAQGAASQIVRALIQRGIVPDFKSAAQKLGLAPGSLDFLNKNVDFGRTNDLAQKATAEGVSVEGQLKQWDADQQRQIKNELGARGMADSGEAPFHLGREAQDYKLKRFNADQQTSDYINGAIAAFTQGERSRLMQLRQAAADAEARQRELLGSATPPPPPSLNMADAVAANAARVGYGPGEFAALTSPGGVNTQDYLKALVQSARTGRAGPV